MENTAASIALIGSAATVRIVNRFLLRTAYQFGQQQPVQAFAFDRQVQMGSQTTDRLNKLRAMADVFLMMKQTTISSTAGRSILSCSQLRIVGERSRPSLIIQDTYCADRPTHTQNAVIHTSEITL